MMMFRFVIPHLKHATRFSATNRSAHTDIKVPDFSKDMRHSVSDPQTPSSQSEDERKIFTYALSGTLLTTGMYAVKSEVQR